MKLVRSAPAKINLCLHVLGRRGDGYHELLMLMQRISLFDRIEVEILPGGNVVVECPGVRIAQGEDNIAAQAARRMLARAGTDGGARITIDKQIPVAAGLGGGSSDAAAVLAALDDLLGLDLTEQELMAEGLRLGADVPFFLLKGASAAWARGVGEQLEPIAEMPSLWYVLVNPGYPVSTAWVFRNLQLTSKNDVVKLPKFSGTKQDILSLLHNDLEAVTLAHFPQLQRIKERLLECAASGVLMSGSGPTVFGVFDALDDAERACELLGREPGWRVFLARSV